MLNFPEIPKHLKSECRYHELSYDFPTQWPSSKIFKPSLRSLRGHCQRSWSLHSGFLVQVLPVLWSNQGQDYRSCKFRISPINICSMSLTVFWTLENNKRYCGLWGGQHQKIHLHQQNRASLHWEFWLLDVQYHLQVSNSWIFWSTAGF